MEAYIFVVRDVRSEPEVKLINFASNESLIKGEPPTLHTSDSD
jgi:hypothetical protein